MKIQVIAKALLKSLGWEVVPFDETQDLRKAVVVIAPHTSTWDLLLGLAVNLAMDQQVNWVGKKEIFRFPFGSFFKKLGGIPLDREQCQNTVLAMVKEFRRRRNFFFAISPEGTRASGTHWRSGFYYIAVKARVPIVLGYLDYAKKQGGFGKVVFPTGDTQKDLEEIKSFYDEIKARHPERFAPVVFRPTKNRDFWRLGEASEPEVFCQA